MIRIFTDGGALHNGKKNAIAAFSVYYNGTTTVRQVPKGMLQSNNVAELSGIILAMKILESDGKTIEPITLYTDSQYSIKCTTVWNKAWIKNGWINAKKQPVKNKELIQEILEYTTKFPNLKFQHVYSHRSEPPRDTEKWIIWNGNNECDKSISEFLKR